MASPLESSAAFAERALQIGVEQWIVDKFVAKDFSTFGRFAFAIAHSPQSQDERPFKNFVDDLLDTEATAAQLAVLRRLFFEAHTMAVMEVRNRVETSSDPATVVKKLPTAERLARQTEQQKRLGGIVFTPETMPANSLVDHFVEMYESGILTYIKPEQCCSRAQEVLVVKKYPSITTDANGMLKVGSKTSDPTCEANSEIKLRGALQRRHLAMDQANLASFSVMEQWAQLLFAHLLKEQPRGFSKVTLQQILDCDRQLFVLASHQTMGKLQSTPPAERPLDKAVKALSESTEILQYLSPMPAGKSHDPPPTAAVARPPKTPKTAKGNAKGNVKHSEASSSTKFKLPEGCVAFDDDNKPLCFGFQTGKCGFKGPAGKRCARGYHKCYKKGCYRLRPYMHCNHTD